MICGFFERPTVRGVIGKANKAFRFASVMACVRQIVFAEQKFKMGAPESGIVSLRSFAKRVTLERGVKGWR